MAPSSGVVSPNDLFLSGYGEIITILSQIVFYGTFLYYAVKNVQDNLAVRYLSPLGSSSGICNTVPQTLNSKFTADINGKWANDPSFTFGQTLYSLQMENTKYSLGSKTYSKHSRWCESHVNHVQKSQGS